MRPAFLTAEGRDLFRPNKIFCVLFVSLRIEQTIPCEAFQLLVPPARKGK